MIIYIYYRFDIQDIQTHTYLYIYICRYTSMQRKKIDTPNHIPPYFVYDICFQENSETVEGGWKTESMLALQPGWDSPGAYYTMLLFTYFQVMNPCIQITRCLVRTMVKSAISWATKRGLTRTNPVHGKDEYRVATDWNFKNEEKDRTETRMSSNFEVQARPALGSSVKMLLHTDL